jgi:hypothetical protein
MFALVLAFVFVSIEIGAAQSAPSAPPATAAAVDRSAGQPAYVPPKTPWGDPDLQGFWPSVDMVGVPLQRPARFGTRNTLTEEEFQKRAQDIQQEEESLLAEIDVFTADVSTPCAIRCPTSPTPHWQETGKPSHQASLIVDPPDGRQPPLSEEGQKRQAQQQAEQRARRERLQGREADTYLDRSLYDRCITRGVLGSILPVIYNNGNEIVQGPGFVAIRNEMIHETRVVPLDGRPHLTPAIKSYMGDSRGWWEGATLVVETTNLNGRTGVGGNGGGQMSERAKLTERFTLRDANTLQYQATIDDPGTWSRPWTIAFPWKREPVYGMFEYACHEGNYAMRNILSGSRAAEKAATAPVK